MTKEPDKAIERLAYSIKALQGMRPLEEIKADYNLVKKALEKLAYYRDISDLDDETIEKLKKENKELEAHIKALDFNDLSEFSNES